MRSNYVRGASLSCSMIQAEIQQMLAGTGAHGFRVASDHGKAAVSFNCGGRRFRLVLEHAGPDSPGAPAHDPLQPSSRIHESKNAQETARQSWRQLSLLIQAKLDAVDSGIVTFDEEFLAYMVMPGGATVFQATAPAITTAYSREEASGE
jgi:hypothetical protein